MRGGADEILGLKSTGKKIDSCIHWKRHKRQLSLISRMEASIAIKELVQSDCLLLVEWIKGCFIADSDNPLTVS